MSEATPGATTDGKSTKFHLPAVEEQVEGLPPGFGDGIAGKAAFLIAVAFSVFQIYVAAYGSIPSQVVRAMHVGFLLLLGFGLIANLRAKSMPAKVLFWTLGVLGFGTGLYNWVFYTDLIRRSGFLTTPD
ncbi:MAG: TRAP transporter permease, partial [Mesorhizobium sp.]